MARVEASYVAANVLSPIDNDYLLKSAVSAVTQHFQLLKSAVSAVTQHFQFGYILGCVVLVLHSSLFVVMELPLFICVHWVSHRSLSSNIDIENGPKYG